MIEPKLLPPVQRAQYDYRSGDCGQDDNPYDKKNERGKWDAYAWEMARLWHADFEAENNLGRQRHHAENSQPIMNVGSAWTAQRLANGIVQFLPKDFDLNNCVDVTPVGARFSQFLNTSTGQRFDCQDFYNASQEKP